MLYKLKENSIMENILNQMLCSSPTDSDPLRKLKFLAPRSYRKFFQCIKNATLICLSDKWNKYQITPIIMFSPKTSV